MDKALPELLGLPDVPVTVFERPPLALALCQVRFPSELSIADQTVVAKFQKAIQSDFPAPAPVRQFELQVPLGVGTATVQQGMLWQFSDFHNIWKVVLGQDFLTLETRRYASFGDFIERLRKVLKALFEHIGPTAITRIGLRYINEIRSEDPPLNAVVRKELLGLAAVPELAPQVENYLQRTTLRYPGRQGINIHHGLVPKGTTVEPLSEEQIPEGPFFLLDFDAFREFPLSEEPSMSVDRIVQEVGVFNGVIYRLFRWAVSEEYIATLGVRDQNAGQL